MSGSLWDFVSGPGFGLPTLTRFFYLDWLSEFLTGLGVLDPGPSLVSGFFFFFSNCLDFFAASYLRMFASGLGVLTPTREHSSRGSFWPLVVTCSLQGEPELDKLVESWGL